MPSPVINVGGSDDSPPPRLARNGIVNSPPSPLVNPDGMPLAAAMRRAPSSTPPLLQRGLSYSVQLPPTFASAANPAIQQLPPACGARQLSKLKRFLTTLMQFGEDISSEVGDQVRSLILALVNSAISTEEFHAKLQETTNFPLRPFVIPFLKTNLPFLQRELLQCARLSTQYPDRYLNIAPHPPPPPSNPFPQTSLHHSVDSFGPPPAKRPAPFLLPSSIPQEQHIPPFHGYPRRSAAPGTDQLQQQHLLRDVVGNGDDIDDDEDDVDVSSEACDDAPDVRGAAAAAASSASAAAAATEAILESRDADSPTPHPFEDRRGGGRPHQHPHSDGAASGVGDQNDAGPEIERDIYYVYHLLSTVSVMMEKARLSLESIKSRNSIVSGDDLSTSEPSRSGTAESEHARSGAAEDKSEIRSQLAGIQSLASPGTSTSSSSSDTAQDLSSHSSSNRDAAAAANGHSAGHSTTKTSSSCASKESTTASTASFGSASSPPPPRTKLSGVITEVERAIHAVESKTSALIADADSERKKLLKRKIAQNDGGDSAANSEDADAGVEGDAKGKEGCRSAAESPSISSSALKNSLEMIVTEGDDPAMFCWNCGREANETCSGCNKAKYCGSFCQHKDWEVHHKNCAQLKEATEDIAIEKCEEEDSEVKTDIDN